MTTREDAYPYPGEQYIPRSTAIRSKSWTIWMSFPPRVPSSSAPSLRSAMVSDTPPASLRSAPRHKRTAQ